MSVATDLTEATWPVFTRLLDEALELPAEQRLSWLEALGVEHEALKPALRSVLTRANGDGFGPWLATLPRSDVALPAADESGLVAGAVVGPYRLLCEIGTGGMGAVWLAERADGTLKRQVALKLPRAVWARGLAERMARERDILAALEHPSIARLYDAGSDVQGRPFLALEYVEGRPIDVYCRERRLSLRQRVQLLLQVGHAVAFAHSRLVIHRDLKPSNILVTADGQVRLLDFGIAKLMEGDRAQETQLTQMAGRTLTLNFASPEQIRGEPIGTASDVYSLAVVGYELLSGSTPYRLKRGSAAELEEAIAGVDAPLASTSAADSRLEHELKGDLDAILNKALKKDPAQRYASVEALAQDLERYLRDEPVLARPDSASYRLHKFVGRNRLAVGASLAVMLAVVAGGGVALWQAQQARGEAARAQAVQGFLLDLFRTNSVNQPDPERARLTTARQLLDIGASRIERELKDQPDSRLLLLATLGDLYRELGLWGDSAKLARQQLVLARQHYGARDVRVVDALDWLAYSLDLQGQVPPEEIDALLDEGWRILDSAGEKTGLRRARLHLATAGVQYGRSFEVTNRHAEQAVTLLRTIRPAPPLLPDALSLLGAVYGHLGRPDEAVSLFKEALTVARQQGRPEHEVVQLQTRLGEAAASAGQVAEADHLLNEALQTSQRLNGPQHGLTLSAKRALVEHLARSGRVTEARAIADDLLRQLRQNEEIAASYFGMEVRLGLFTVYSEQGDINATEQLLAEMPGADQRARDSVALMAVVRQQAHVALLRGHAVQAREAIDRALAMGRRIGVAPGTRATLDLARADLQWQAQFGTADAAWSALAAYRALMAQSQRIDNQQRAALRLGESRLRLRQGDAPGAVVAAKEALELAAQASAASRSIGEAEARMALAEALAAPWGADHRPQGDCVAALPLMEGAEAIFAQHHVRTSPWRLRAQALTGLCRLQLGLRDAVRDTQRSVAGPLVDAGAISSYFDQPLRALLKSEAESTPTVRTRRSVADGAGKAAHASR